ncbi:hypothetical protein EK21DRAFT_79208 [Setomelanomma holmii]|uniref:Spherulin-4 n=1 Tax=Setomelanomma holmii TaxID=210430 RepID=A0A9P4LGB8_9PLEO|nr:hypothetical protein EK21DRAFT_79208 [Setomelanomma holmii]
MDASVIVPLYVYPAMGAWDPGRFLPKDTIHYVVNVHNEPGEGVLPSAEYSHATETLNSFDNIRTVACVATMWCARNLTSVLDEIAAYSFWGDYDESIAIDGIFVDETPTQYAPDYASYLQTIAQAVYESDGIKDGYIGKATFQLGTGAPGATVHNPGALPDSKYFSEVLSPDLTIIFENTFSNWSIESCPLADASQQYNHSRLALLLHSVPELSIIDTATTLVQLLAVGQSVWLTGTNNYTELNGQFPQFIDCLATLLS